MPPISLRLLGTFEVLRDGAPVTRFRGDKVRALLAYLATEAERPHARAALAALLWSEQGDELALRNLAQAVVRLRAALGDAGTLLESTREALRWRGAAWVDVREFEQLARSAEVRDLARAAELYGGEFLAGFSLPDCEAFEEWLLLRREQLHQLALHTLARLADAHERAGEYAALCQYARQQLVLEPWDEAAQRQLMRGLALAGDRSAALSQYERCCEVLADELGVEPDVETRALYEQICAGHLTPATRNLAAPRHNLPAPLTPFVGREAELAELAALQQQPDTRLLTLIGAGGMGKTRLAIELARAGLEAYADGVFFVALAPLAAASALPTAIAQALDLTIHHGDPAVALLRFLRSKQLLLILDNFEHLLEGAELVVALLQEAPRLEIITTSRTRLNVRGEQIYVVQGLEYAAEATPAQAATSAAVRLFAQAARRARPGFHLSEANLPALLRICALVQGMPLGLELAAAWTEMLSLDEIAQEVERSIDFLAAEWSDAPERQRSMRAVFEWSWRLLSEGERQVLRRLAVFRGPFTRDAAERVAGAALPVLTRLVHKSLLRLGASEGAVGRYEMHELLRQYAAEQLDHVPDERAALEARHSEYYLAFVAARQRRLARNEPREASAEIRGEIDNVRQAWAWAAEQAVVEALERSTFALRQFYTLAGLALEGERSFRTAAECLLAQARSDQLAHARPGRDALLSMLLAAQAHFLESLGKYDQVIPAAQQAIAAGRASGEPAGETIGHLLVGHALFRQGHCADARPHIERALRLARSSQGRVRQQEALYEAEWQALVRLGVLDEDAGDYQAAKAYFAQALQLCQTLGKRHGVSTCLSNSGTIELFLGEYAAATANFQQALRLAREEGDRWGEGLAQLALGMVSIAEGQFVRASDALAAALAIFTASGDRLFEAYTLAYQGRLADSLSDYRGAREWLDRSLALSQEVGAWKAQFNACLFLALLLQHLGDEETAHHYAEQSQQIAVKAGGRSRQADALLALGHARAGLQKPAEALAAYQQALTLYDQLGRAHLAVEARAGLASLALAAGDLAAALGQVEAIWKVLASHPHAGQDEPFSIYLVCYRVLEAVGDPRATTVVQTAQRLLREYADSIADAALRRSFLANVATHRALLEAAATAYTGAPQLS